MASTSTHYPDELYSKRKRVNGHGQLKGMRSFRLRAHYNTEVTLDAYGDFRQVLLRTNIFETRKAKRSHYFTAFTQSGS